MKRATKGGSGKFPAGIRTIADALGISVATVHRALHNQGRISEETRLRVLRTAEQMGYRPNQAARDLRLNRRCTVSVHFPTTIAAYFDSLQCGIEAGSNPFQSFVDIEFHRYARNSGRAYASIHAAIEAKVDGIIAVPANTAQMMRLVAKAREREIPVICVSTDVPESGRLTAVTPYPYSSGAMAAEVLAAGAKKISNLVVLAGDMENLHHREKIRGFKEMLAQIQPRAEVAAVIEAHDSPEKAHQEMRHCLRTIPKIGGLYVSSANSIAALEALREAGQADAFPVVTTDLFPELIPYIRQGAVRATIYQCPELQGSLAIQTLYNYLQHGTVPPANISVTPQLVMRSNLDLYLSNDAARLAHQSGIA